jgi:hypothetical protein
VVATELTPEELLEAVRLSRAFVPRTDKAEVYIEECIKRRALN